MKILRLLAGILFIGQGIAWAQTDYVQPICGAIQQFYFAYTNSAYIVYPTQMQINLAASQGKTAYAHWAINYKKCAGQMALADTSKCPPDFKTAWKNLALEMANSDAKVWTPILEGAMHGEIGAVAGIGKAFTNKQDKLRAMQNAVMQLQLCWSSYGVTNWVKQIQQ
jgi:hypothetical protein